MSSLVALVFACVLIASQATLTAHGQGGNWQTYSPRGSNFSVEAPAPLRKVESFSGEHNASLERSQRIEWASCYSAIETIPGDSRFGVIVINANQKQLRSEAREGEYGLFRYLGGFLIGNEDESTPTSVQAIEVNGVKGKEYIYTYMRGGVSARGRIFETKGRIYVVVFAGQEDKDLTSADATRFLNSFRVRR